MNTRNISLKRFGSPAIVVIVLVVYSGGCTVDFGIGTDDPDARSPDALVEDAAPPDGALSDAGPVDAAPQDAGPIDAGQQDAAVTCGDGVVDVDEECDDGINNSDTAPNACRNNCHLPWCGDGVTDTGEQCDDGVANSNIVPNACRTSCSNPFCGDAVVDNGEQCDDGNGVNSDSCRNTCVNATCGDGVVWTGQEQCDDGNTTAGDGCSATCNEESLPELRWLSSTSAGWSTPWVITYAGEIHAPTTPIRAAVSVEAAGRVILFTQTTYHVLRIPQLTWYDSGTLAADFDFMPAAGPQAGYGLAGGTTSGVTLASGHWAYIYDYTHATGNVSFVVSDDIDTNGDWLTPEAPDPNQLVSMYMDLSNDHGWVNDTLISACGSGTGNVVGHEVALTSTLLHLQEIGNCFDFYDQMSFTAFAPFANAVSGRPVQSEIRGTFYFDTTNTLYVVTQQ